MASVEPVSFGGSVPVHETVSLPSVNIHTNPSPENYALDEDEQPSPVAQLPISPTQMHFINNTSSYTRSQSVPSQLKVDEHSATPPSGYNLAVMQNGELRNNAVSKIEHLKNWSISTYKCTKQLIAEKLGKTSRTVDTELEIQIEQLRDMQKKYSNILRLSRALTSHFQNAVSTQQGLGEAFADLAQKSPELRSEFLCNAETQQSLSRSGEALLSALHFFVSSVNTLVNKTMEDTLITVKRYESARIEYDAYRTDLELAMQGTRADSNSAALAEVQRAYDERKTEFEKLRADVSIKLRFLDENRIKVMHKQLLLFHQAVSSYFSGNQAALDATLKQFSIKMKTGNAAPQSWLEQ